MPAGRQGSHEDVLHRVLAESALLLFSSDRSLPWLATPLGHRAIGVIYDPTREFGNYVPTRMGRRYDALIWMEETHALHALHHEARPVEPEYETEPSGF
jgi:erythromycin esterase-like protein